MTTLDHELKLQRAVEHLKNLEAQTQSWVYGCHYSVRYEFDPQALWAGPFPPGLWGVPGGSILDRRQHGRGRTR